MQKIFIPSLIIIQLAASTIQFSSDGTTPEGAVTGVNSKYGTGLNCLKQGNSYFCFYHDEVYPLPASPQCPGSSRNLIKPQAGNQQILSYCYITNTRPSQFLGSLFLLPPWPPIRHWILVKRLHHKSYLAGGTCSSKEGMALSTSDKNTHKEAGTSSLTAYWRRRASLLWGNGMGPGEAGGGACKQHGNFYYVIRKEFNTCMDVKGCKKIVFITSTRLWFGGRRGRSEQERKRTVFTRKSWQMTFLSDV